MLAIVVVFLMAQNPVQALSTSTPDLEPIGEDRSVALVGACKISVGNCTEGHCIANLAGFCSAWCAVNVASSCEGSCFIAVASYCPAQDACLARVAGFCPTELVPGPTAAAEECNGPDNPMCSLPDTCSEVLAQIPIGAEAACDSGAFFWGSLSGCVAQAGNMCIIGFGYGPYARGCRVWVGTPNPINALCGFPLMADA